MRPGAGEDLVARAAWRALGEVRDPEIDEPITDLGFVESLAVDGSTVSVHLRLPTYFCAANFAYLMVADSREALGAVEGIEEVHVVLDDHYASEEINAGVAAAEGFESAFPGEADGELGELRSIFERKAYVAALEQLCRVLVSGGRPVEALGSLSLDDVGSSTEKTRVLRRRADLGLPVNGSAPLMMDEDGERVAGPETATWLRRARPVRVSIAANASFCRGLLRTRYALDELSAETAGSVPGA